MKFFQYIIDRWLIFGLLVIALPIVAGTFAYRSLPKEGEPEISAPVAVISQIIIVIFIILSQNKVEN